MKVFPATTTPVLPSYLQRVENVTLRVHDGKASVIFHDLPHISLTDVVSVFHLRSQQYLYLFNQATDETVVAGVLYLSGVSANVQSDDEILVVLGRDLVPLVDPGRLTEYNTRIAVRDHADLKEQGIELTEMDQSTREFDFESYTEGSFNFDLDETKGLTLALEYSPDGVNWTQTATYGYRGTAKVQRLMRFFRLKRITANNGFPIKINRVEMYGLPSSTVVQSQMPHGGLANLYAMNGRFNLARLLTSALAVPDGDNGDSSLSVAQMVQTGTNTFDRVREAKIFPYTVLDSQTGTTPKLLRTITASKKARILRYIIEISPNIAAAGAGGTNIVLNLQDANNNVLATHMIYAPAAADTTRAGVIVLERNLGSQGIVTAVAPAGGLAVNVKLSAPLTSGFITVNAALMEE